jgi:DNA-binding LacI/PurR family transcriptional regulator
MGLRKSLGIIVFCIQAVVAVDYNMQIQKAGLGPGELSMTAYAAIVQARYDKPEVTTAAQEGGQEGWNRVAQSGAQSGAQGDAEPEPPTPVCIRRGTARDC